MRYEWANRKATASKDFQATRDEFITSITDLVNATATKNHAAGSGLYSGRSCGVLGTAGVPGWAGPKPVSADAAGRG
jgi:hypothetical protein